jgi:hypothetical protein
LHKKKESITLELYVLVLLVDLLLCNYKDVLENLDKKILQKKILLKILKMQKDPYKKNKDKMEHFQTLIYQKTL